MKDYSKKYLVNQSPSAIFNALIHVRDWWSDLYDEKIEGRSEELNDEFTFRAGDGVHYSKQKLVTLIPDKKIEWLVTESELSFIEKKDEWTGTKLCFEFFEKGDQTEVRFTHIGLVPAIECYADCSSAWGSYLDKFLSPLEKTGAKEIEENVR